MLSKLTSALGPPWKGAVDSEKVEDDMLTGSRPALPEVDDTC